MNRSVKKCRFLFQSLGVFFLGSLSVFAQSGWMDPVDGVSLLTEESEAVVSGLLESDPAAHACSRMNLTEEQKEELHQAFMAHRKKMIDFKAQVAKARLEMAAQVHNTSTDLQVATKAGIALATAQSSLQTERTLMMTQVLFQILDANQREAALHCFKAKKMAKKRRNLRNSCSLMNHRTRRQRNSQFEFRVERSSRGSHRHGRGRMGSHHEGKHSKKDSKPSGSAEKAPKDKGGNE